MNTFPNIYIADLVLKKNIICIIVSHSYFDVPMYDYFMILG